MTHRSLLWLQELHALYEPLIVSLSQMKSITQCNKSKMEHNGNLSAEQDLRNHPVSPLHFTTVRQGKLSNLKGLWISHFLSVSAACCWVAHTSKWPFFGRQSRLVWQREQGKHKFILFCMGLHTCLRMFVVHVPVFQHLCKLVFMPLKFSSWIRASIVVYYIIFGGGNSHFTFQYGKTSERRGLCR